MARNALVSATAAEILGSGTGGRRILFYPKTVYRPLPELALWLANLSTTVYLPMQQ